VLQSLWCSGLWYACVLLSECSSYGKTDVLRVVTVSNQQPRYGEPRLDFSRSLVSGPRPSPRRTFGGGARAPFRTAAGNRAYGEPEVQRTLTFGLPDTKLSVTRSQDIP